MKVNKISLFLLVACLFSVACGSAANYTRRYNPNAKSPLLDLSLEKPRGLNIEGKIAIARKAVNHIRPGDTIFLDGSTTSYYLSKQLTHPYLFFINILFLYI